MEETSEGVTLNASADRLWRVSLRHQRHEEDIDENEMLGQ